MKKFLFFLVAILSVHFEVISQTIITIGPSGADYTTLKEAFDAINSGTVNGSIFLAITGNTTETATASLNASGSGSASYISVLIRPSQQGVTISGNLNAPLIRLNGASYVTIDGRVNGAGTADLIVTNASTGNTASTVQIIGNATTDTIKYCRIRGATSASFGGVVHIGAGTTIGVTGFVFDRCEITRDDAGYPRFLIYSIGNGLLLNSGVVTNCLLSEYRATSSFSYAIYLGSYNTNWVISGNSIFQSTIVPGASFTLGGISIATGNGYVIDGNFIGGSAPGATGNPWTTSVPGAIRFVGMNLASGVVTPTEVTNNYIGNFLWNASSSASAIPGLWAGIYLSGGSFNVGTHGGNQIGSDTGNDNIVVTTTSSSNVPTSFGIVTTTSGSGTLDISNNRIGSITVTNIYNMVSSGHRFTGMLLQYGGFSVRDNLIGSEITPQSIRASNSQSVGSPTLSQDVVGIIANYSGSNSVIISDNTIKNLHNAWQVAGTVGAVRGISISAGTGAQLISGNLISRLTTAVPNTGTGAACGVIGILSTSGNPNQTISQNELSELTNNYTGGSSVSIAGIVITGAASAGRVSSNLLKTLRTGATANSGGNLLGINIMNGKFSVDNNIVDLDNDGLSNPATIIGILDQTPPPQGNNYYFNSVRIGGGQQSGNNANSFAFRRDASGTIILKNNIFLNERSGNQGFGKHYAIGFNDNSGAISCDFNDYFVTGQGGVPGLNGAADRFELPMVDGGDAESLMVDPEFAPATNLQPGTEFLNNQGVTIPEILNDFDGTSRRDPPDPGAHEFSMLAGVETYAPPLTIGVESATISGQADPHNEMTSGIFEYGLTTEYGLSEPWNTTPVGGTTPVTVSTELTGLIPNATYHYRISSTTPAGTSVGEDELFTTLSAASTAFTGNVSPLWEHYGNWDRGVPGPGTDVTVPEGKFTSINSSAVCQNLTIEKLGAMTVSDGGELSVAGNFTIRSEIDGAGSAIFSAGSVSISGETRIERLISGASSSWHLISSPVEGQQVTGAFTPAGSWPDGSGYDCYLWHEPSRTWMNRKAETWSSVNDGNLFIPGRGYLVAYQEANPLKTFIGTPNAGLFRIPLTNSGSGIYSRTNLAGNPYPSAIDWKSASGFDKSDLDEDENGGSSIYIYNHDAGNYGVYSDAMLGDGGTNGVSRYIPQSQGFFVIARQGLLGPGLLVNDDCRIHHSQIWMKKSGGSQWLFRVTRNGSRGKDEVLVEFGHDGSLKGLPKWNSFEEDMPSLAFLLYGKNYSALFASEVGFLPNLELLFQPGTSGEYLFEAFLNGDPLELLLEDRLTGQMTDLVQHPFYTFQAASGQDPNRFVLRSRVDDVARTTEKPAFLLIREESCIKLIPVDGHHFTGKVAVYNLLGQQQFYKEVVSVREVLIPSFEIHGIALIRIASGNDQSVLKALFN